MTQDQALTILKTGANVFLTGEPGSGKTHTVNAYVEWLREHNIEPAITASTGIAATHIGGYTVHSWSGIGIKRGLSEQDLDQITQNERVAKRILSTAILIIDEVSMLGPETLHMVDAVVRQVRHRYDEPFGGMQVILVGDFFQLPPVSPTGAWDTKRHGNLWEEAPPGRFAFSGDAWKQLNPLVCYLSEQHRQEDAQFLEILSAIRRSDVTHQHRETLTARGQGIAKANVPRLFSHNADVDSVNDEQLGKLPTASRTFLMTRNGPERVTDALTRGCLSPDVLVLKEGARVMFTKNNFVEHFVNGTLGTVVGFEQGSGYPIVETLSGFRITVEPMSWAIEEGGKVVASITQTPLRLAWAMTIHKSQGMSLDAAQMDLSHTFEYGQGYVALSRVRTLKGLVLDGMNERALEIDPEVASQDEDFRTRSGDCADAFAKMDGTEIKEMQDAFVKSCGGAVVKHGMKSKVARRKKSKSVL
jgi:ATP-dependent exoDNAse (exonuclease V) alpha subunit